MLQLIFFLIFITTCHGQGNEEPVVLRAVRGRDAQLPCGQGKIFLDGPNSYILWLKNDRDFMYRFPNEHIEKSEPFDVISLLGSKHYIWKQVEKVSYCIRAL